MHWLCNAGFPVIGGAATDCARPMPDDGNVVMVATGRCVSPGSVRGARRTVFSLHQAAPTSPAAAESRGRRSASHAPGLSHPQKAAAAEDNSAASGGAGPGRGHAMQQPVRGQPQGTPSAGHANPMRGRAVDASALSAGAACEAIAAPAASAFVAAKAQVVEGRLAARQQGAPRALSDGHRAVSGGCQALSEERQALPDGLLSSAQVPAAKRALPDGLWAAVVQQWRELICPDPMARSPDHNPNPAPDPVVLSIPRGAEPPNAARWASVCAAWQSQEREQPLAAIAKAGAAAQDAMLLASALVCWRVAQPEASSLSLGSVQGMQRGAECASPQAPSPCREPMRQGALPACASAPVGGDEAADSGNVGVLVSSELARAAASAGWDSLAELRARLGCIAQEHLSLLAPDVRRHAQALLQPAQAELRSPDAQPGLPERRDKRARTSSGRLSSGAVCHGGVAKTVPVATVAGSPGSSAAVVQLGLAQDMIPFVDTNGSPWSSSAAAQLVEVEPEQLPQVGAQALAAPGVPISPAWQGSGQGSGRGKGRALRGRACARLRVASDFRARAASRHGPPPASPAPACLQAPGVAEAGSNAGTPEGMPGRRLPTVAPCAASRAACKLPVCDGDPKPNPDPAVGFRACGADAPGVSATCADAAAAVLRLPASWLLARSTGGPAAGLDESAPAGPAWAGAAPGESAPMDPDLSGAGAGGGAAARPILTGAGPGESAAAEPPFAGAGAGEIAALEPVMVGASPGDRGAAERVLARTDPGESGPAEPTLAGAVATEGAEPGWDEAGAGAVLKRAWNAREAASDASPGSSLGIRLGPDRPPSARLQRRRIGQVYNEKEIVRSTWGAARQAAGRGSGSGLKGRGRGRGRGRARGGRIFRDCTAVLTAALWGTSGGGGGDGDGGAADQGASAVEDEALRGTLKGAPGFRLREACALIAGAAVGATGASGGSVDGAAARAAAVDRCTDADFERALVHRLAKGP